MVLTEVRRLEQLLDQDDVGALLGAALRTSRSAVARLAARSGVLAN